MVMPFSNGLMGMYLVLMSVKTFRLYDKLKSACPYIDDLYIIIEAQVFP